ncbi:MAG: DUF2950 domain-containing protein [Phycisphaerae bacterium]
MNKYPLKLSGVVTAILLSGVFLLSGSGCQSQNTMSAHTAAGGQTVAQDRPGQPAVGQELFPSDDAAAAALLAAVKTQNHTELHRIFGPEIKELVSGDKVEDHRHFEEFVAHAKQKFWLEKKNADTSIVHIGNKNWPFPIPITRLADGKWFFDTQAGKAEILARRIGADELDTIKVCEAYVLAQRQYASTYHDGADVLRYAQRLVSKPGTQDGLYWPAAVGQPESPFGPLAAQAAAEGYKPGIHKSQGPHPFNGYYFRILTKQGAAAPGGKYNYVINGNMIAGFALVAFPSKYGASGVMTFIVNQQGRVYQKDLGPDTTTIARHMTRYNPDKTWTLIQE